MWWLVVACTLCLDRAFFYLLRNADDVAAYTFAGLAISALQIAPTVKRLHDVGRAGWWFVPYFVLPALLLVIAVNTPNAALYVLTSFAGLMIILWAIFELGVVRGPPGANRYGRDPLA